MRRAKLGHVCLPLLALLCLGCTGRSVKQTPAANPASAAPFAGLPMPPLTLPAPAPIRHSSANSVPVNNSNIYDKDSGGQSGPGGGGSFSIIAGGDEALAWAVFDVGLDKTDRPAQLDLHVQSIIAGGDEALGWY